MKRKWYGQVNYSGFPYVDMRFDRDNSGLITSITSDSGDKALTALTNNDLEIEQVQHTLPQVFDEDYSYDTRGNRLTSLINSFNYNDLNQLTSTNTHTYTYDLDGNMIEEKNLTTTETKKFYYNAENRMIKYEHYPTEIEPVNIVAEYKYDIYGRRIQKNVNGTITNFHWEGDNMSFELNENYQPIRRYIYENGKDDVQGYVEYAEVDDPQYFSFERKGWYSYIKDQVGTITKVYKHENKQMVDTRTYDTFGNLINQTGSSNGNLGFQSKYFDQESGLNYYYHRYYYPQIGRFINEDPIGLSGGLNMYGFVKNNPIKWIDPFGLDNKDNVIDDLRDDYKELIGKVIELQERMKRLREMWKRHDEQDSINCPTYEGCLGRCLKAAFGITDVVIFASERITKKIGVKYGSKALISASSKISATSIITSGALLVYCEIHCGINVKAY